MAAITLPCGRVALVDDADLPIIAGHRWRAAGTDKKGYYAVSGMGRAVTMHRLVTAAPRGMVVDHINGNTLDNRQQNLRVCTQKENSRNRKRHRAEGYKGVSTCKRNGKWRATIGVDGRVIELGRYESQIEAAINYDAAARVFHGEFARLNFNPARDWIFPYVAADYSERL